MCSCAETVQFIPPLPHAHCIKVDFFFWPAAGFANDEIAHDCDPLFNASFMDEKTFIQQ